MSDENTHAAPTPDPTQEAPCSTLCLVCDAEVGQAKFCPECGTAVPKPCAPCSACGYRPERATKFCPECGTPMT